MQTTVTFSQDFFDALLIDPLRPTPPSKEQLIAAVRTEIETFRTQPDLHKQ